MGIEVTREAAAELWPEWQGALINGAYPLLRILHGSDDSAVFVTDGTSLNAPSAAIRIVAMEGGHAQVQLRRWQAATALSIPIWFGFSTRAVVSSAPGNSFSW